MKGKLVIVLTLLYVCCGAAEKYCSRYHYEEQILEKVVRLEYKLERLEDTVNKRGKFYYVEDIITNIFLTDRAFLFVSM